MSTPAGWYDDGSGRQRWWDGGRWTEHFAPAQGDPAPAQPVYSASPMMHMPTGGERVSPVLGFIGLGLAALGTILACVPVLFGVGFVVLFAGFVVSLIGLFKKNAAKWPSIVGMILSVVGGIIGGIVVIIVLAANLALSSSPNVPTGTSSPPSTTQPSESPATEESDERPASQDIGDGLAILVRAGGITTYDDMPDFYPCMGQFLYDSDVSDESLQLIADGQDVTGPEREAVGQVITAATLACDPQM